MTFLSSPPSPPDSDTDPIGTLDPQIQRYAPRILSPDRSNSEDFRLAAGRAPAIFAAELGLGFDLDLGRVMEDNANGVPEDLRCKRSDGKQWRCNALSMPDKTVCEKHYYQAKKRAANSALRASLKKARTKYPNDSPDPNLEGRDEDTDAPRSTSMSPLNGGGGGSWEIGKKYKDKPPKGQGGYSRGSLRPGEEAQRDALHGEDSRVKSAYNTPPTSKDAKSVSGIGTEEYSERSSDSSEAEGLTCHQCRRNDRANVAWCIGCDQKGYCDSCIARWYPEIPIEDIQKMCPACRGICNCRVCFNADILIKAKVQEIAPMDKLQYLHRLLSFILPVLKQIFDEQCFEIGVETRVLGIEADIPRAKINADEQMCCDLCKIPIFDYHRHCTNCLYDLCLTCCHELRQASDITIKGDPGDSQISERSRDVSAAAMLQLESSDKISLHSIDQPAIDFSHLFPKWRANSDGSIPCGPEEAGGCGLSQLVLRRILKINWAAKLVKNAKEIVSGCKVSNTDTSYGCGSCTGSTTSQAIGSIGLCLRPCSQRDSNDDLLYCPTSQDIKNEGIGHFQKHWVKGEPIIVKHVLEDLPASTWDPMRIWRGIQGIADERMKDDTAILKAIDCINQSEVDIDLDRFITGYSEGCMRESEWPQMLKLKDSPPSSALEELISCHRPEFLSNLPLIEFLHFKWGVHNLAAKLPHDSLQTEVGPNIVIAYGKHEELARGDSVANLRINMGDLVHILMHSADMDSQAWLRSRTQKSEDTCNVSDEIRSHWNAHVGNPTLNLNERLNLVYQASQEHTKQRECGTDLNNKGDEIMLDRVCNGPSIDFVAVKGVDLSLSGRDVVDVPKKGYPVAVWDIFRRQDVPKLNEFLTANWKEFTKSSGRPVNSVIHPVYHQSLFLNKDHKRRLKEEFRIEPWTFEQYIGEAIFIPAGCPFQVRNLQSSAQLSFDFLTPESLRESVRMAHEIRSLPTDHEVKLNMLEVGKMSLYAASSAIREIQKITLDPKLSSDIRFEDRNLTESVSENIVRFTKRRQIACT